MYQELHSTPFVWQTSNSKMSRSMCRLQCCHVVKHGNISHFHGFMCL